MRRVSGASLARQDDSIDKMDKLIDHFLTPDLGLCSEDFNMVENVV